MLPLIYWCLNRKLGLQLIFVLIIGIACNDVLKSIFQTPRPFEASSVVIPLVEQSGYGIPSGHVMVGIVFWGYLVYALRLRALMIGLVLYIAVMGWSRMYLGVHYPQDVFFGVVFGLPVLWLAIRAVEIVPPFWTRLSLSTRLAMLTFLTIVMTVMLFETEYGTVITGLTLGTGLGIILHNERAFFAPPISVQQKALCYLLGIVIMFALFFGTRFLIGALIEEETTLYLLMRIPRYAIVAFFSISLYPMLARRIGLLRPMDTPPMAVQSQPM